MCLVYDNEAPIKINFKIWAFNQPLSAPLGIKVVIRQKQVYVYFC